MEGSCSTCWYGAQTIGGETIICETSKCLFGVQEVEYMGHIVSQEGVKIDPKKLKPLRNGKSPQP